MTATGGDRAIEIAAATSVPVSTDLDIPNMNPQTGLATDYLNHFTEAFMMLDLAASMPECLDELRAWRPMTYPEHFAASGFSNNEVIIRAYEAANPRLRAALDEASQALNAAVVESRKAVLEQLETPEAGTITQNALQRLQPLFGHLSAVIHGNKTKIIESIAGSQAEIDAMFAE